MRTRNQSKNVRFDSSYRIENILLLCYCDVKFKILDSQAAIAVLDHHIMIIALATAHVWRATCCGKNTCYAVAILNVPANAGFELSG